ncbi:hypothetical protein R6Z07F_007600 [Ovis aries]
MPPACSRGQRRVRVTEKLDSATSAASSGPVHQSSIPAALWSRCKPEGFEFIFLVHVRATPSAGRLFRLVHRFISQAGSPQPICMNSIGNSAFAGSCGVCAEAFGHLVYKTPSETPSCASLLLENGGLSGDIEEAT